MTDLENKAETTPSTQTSPEDADKPEVDLLETSETSRFPNSYYTCGITFRRLCRKRYPLWTEADSWASYVLNKQFSTVFCEVMSVFTVGQTTNVESLT